MDTFHAKNDVGGGAGDDDDVHLCLRCKVQITGLCEYVVHRKNGCLQLGVNPTCDTGQANQHMLPSVTIDTNLGMDTPLSIDTYSDVADEKETLDEFFQSLELQRHSCRDDKNSTERHGEILDFINSSAVTEDKDHLPISSILNMLDFSSDDDGLFGSDDEAPPRNHTGGKWKPGQRENTRAKKVKSYTSPLTTKSAKRSEAGSKGELISPNRSGHSKWRGKLGAMKILQDSEQDLECSGCDVLLESTPLRENDASGCDTGAGFHCKVCQRRFTNKYTAARHFVSAYHQRLALTHPDRIDMFQQYHSYLLYFSLFQCRVCRFYCNTGDDLTVHLSSRSHVTACHALLGPVMCAGCKFLAATNESLLTHVASAAHLTKHKKSKACIVKERRYRIKCKFCSVTQHSLVHMKRHVLSKHRTAKSALKASNIVTPEMGGKDKNDVFNCSQCVFTSKIARVFASHYKKEHGSRPFHCEPCGVSFTSQANLVSHQKTLNHLRMDRAVEVTFVCGGDETDRFLYKCQVCDKQFNHRKHLQLHVHKTHKDQTAKALSCADCGKKFDDDKLFRYHGFSHSHAFHENDLLRIHGRSDVTSVKYLKFLDQIDHLKIKDIVKCPEVGCGKSFPKTNITAHLRTHTGDKIYSCPLCDKRFIHGKSVQLHVKRHLGIFRETCHICSKEFSEAYFKTHMQTHNNMFICEMCSRNFGTKSALMNHQKLAHETKTFVCEFEKCGWRFAKRESLESHRRRHTGEKPFSCEFCDYRGKDAARVRKHVLSKHQKRTLKSFACDYCDYRGGSRTHLRRHLRIHTGARPYRCPYCEYSCQTHDNLRKHILNTNKHKNATVYKCKLCEFGANTVNEFRWHLSSSHARNVNLDDPLVVSTYTGVYQKDDDIQRPPEGTRIIPVRETNKSRRLHQEVLKCPMCSYECKNRETMNKHMAAPNRKHPGQDLFTCKLCDFRGSDLNDVLYHIENVHEDTNQDLTLLLNPFFGKPSVETEKSVSYKNRESDSHDQTASTDDCFIGHDVLMAGSPHESLSKGVDYFSLNY